MWDQANGDRTAIFHYGHMAGDNKLILGDNAALSSLDVENWVYDYCEFSLVWLWACNQANYGPNIGMPG